MAPMHDLSNLEPVPEPIQEGSQETGGTRPEGLEALEQDKRVAQVTFEPEAVVERGDIHQAEAIEDAFVTAVEALVIPTDTRQPETGSSDIKLDEPQAVESQVSEAGLRNEEGGDQVASVVDKTPPASDQAGDTESVPLTLEQVIERNPVVSSKTPDDSPEAAQDRQVEAIPGTAAPGSESGGDSGRQRPVPDMTENPVDTSAQSPEISTDGPVGTASQEIDPEILMERDPQAQALEAIGEARDAGAEAESTAAALEAAGEELEATREVYETSLDDLQDAIDKLNVLLIANGYEPVTITVGNDGITISNNINSSIYGDVYGEAGDILAEILTLGNYEESWDNADAWAEANALRIEVLAKLGIANMALSRMNQAQSNYDDLQGQSSEASEDAQAAEAEAQEAIARAQAAENVYRYGMPGERSDVVETLVSNSEAERLAAEAERLAAERAELVEARGEYEEALAAYEVALMALQGELVPLNALLVMVFQEPVTLTVGTDQITLSDNYYSLEDPSSQTEGILGSMAGESAYAQIAVIRSQVDLKLGFANLALAKMNQARAVYEDLQNQYDYIDLANDTDAPEATD